MYFLENRKRDGTDGTDGTDPYFFIKKEGNIVLDTENGVGHKAGQLEDKGEGGTRCVCMHGRDKLKCVVSQ